MRRTTTLRQENQIALALAEIERLKAISTRTTDGRVIVSVPGSTPGDGHTSDGNLVPIETSPHVLYGSKHKNSFLVTAAEGVSLTIFIQAGQVWAGGSFRSLTETTLQMDDATTNYVYVSAAGAIASNAVSFPADGAPLATVVTVGGDITSVNDRRSYLSTGGAVIGSLHDADQLIDDDGDTSVEVERGADDDTIRLKAATVDVALIASAGQWQLPIQGSGAGILLGGDAQLYRVAADILRTPDTLIVDTALGIGVTAVPNNAVGWARLEIKGTVSSSLGPHIQTKVSTNDWPVFQFFSFNHDNLAINFDAYWDGSWRSSHVGSNFQIYKLNNALEFNYESGIAAGDGVSWLTGMSLSITGQVSLPTEGIGAGILIGGDCLWYRTSANVWRTPDTVVVDGQLFVSQKGSFTHADGIRVGQDDAVRGRLDLFGSGAASAIGGLLRVYLAADHDTNFDYWGIGVDNDDLRFFSSDASVTNIMTAEGQLQMPIQGSGAGLLLGGDVLLYRDAANMLRTPDSLTVDVDLITDSVIERTNDQGVDVEGTILRDGVVWGQTVHPEIGVSSLFAITLNGNEITDRTRALGIEGDGWVVPDSSIGIWEPATNLITNGGFETNTTGWVEQGSTTTRVTTEHKFGAAAAQIVTDNAGANEGPYHAFTGAATTVYSVSAWVRGFGGTVRIALWDDVAGKQASSPITLTPYWQRITHVATTGAASVSFRVYIETDVQQNITFNIDGAQSERAGLPTPYVETDGGTAIRNFAQPQVTVAGLLDETQGWVAFRVRSGWNDGDGTTAHPRFWVWRDDNDNNFLVWYRNQGDDRWAFQRENGGVSDTIWFSITPMTKDVEVTVIATWTATGVSLSVDGAPFETTVSANIPTLAISTFDIGTRLGGQISDSDFFWFACGLGTLTDLDARLIHAAGNTPPRKTDLPSLAAPTLLWNCNTRAASPDLLLQDPDVISIDYANQQIGFFGTTPISRPSAYTQTFATADKTHENPTASAVGDLVATSGGWGASTEANFDLIHTTLDALVADMADIKQLVNAVIDDLQAYGILQ